MKLGHIAKAIVGALGAGLGALAMAIQAHGGDVGKLTAGDLIVILSVVLAAGGLVHQTPNAQP